MNKLIAKKTDNILFGCKHNDARPRPLISWTFNDTIIRKTDKKYSIEKNTLLVKNISNKDQGVYKCILSNNYHPDQTINYTLQIHGKLDIIVYLFINFKLKKISRISKQNLF